MKGQRVVHSRQSDLWTTPRALFDALNAQYGPFTLDAAATPETALCDRYWTPQDDALTQDWGGADHTKVWLNPPYSQCRAFMAKAWTEATKGCTVVCLVPARTDTRWWHTTVWDATRDQPYLGVRLKLLKGRLRFGDATASAPFPSAVVVFGV